MGMTEEPLDPEVAGEMGRMAAALDAEVRAEQAEYEAMALRTSWRARSIADVARTWMVRGDTVEVDVAGRRLVGEVQHVGEDLLVLSTARAGEPPAAVDVALAAGPLLRVVSPNPSGRRPPGRGARTLRARLTEHETSGVDVIVTLADEREVGGVIDAVATDHLLLRTTTGATVVPWSRIALVQPLAAPAAAGPR